MLVKFWIKFFCGKNTSPNQNAENISGSILFIGIFHLVKKKNHYFNS